MYLPLSSKPKNAQSSLRVTNIFRIQRNNEAQIWTQEEQAATGGDDRRLLWSGSKASNIQQVLKYGSDFTMPNLYFSDTAKSR